jgi:hypothetical protein
VAGGGGADQTSTTNRDEGRTEDGQQASDYGREGGSGRQSCEGSGEEGPHFVGGKGTGQATGEGEGPASAQDGEMCGEQTDGR